MVSPNSHRDSVAPGLAPPSGKNQSVFAPSDYGGIESVGMV